MRSTALKSPGGRWLNSRRSPPNGLLAPLSPGQPLPDRVFSETDPEPSADARCPRRPRSGSLRPGIADEVAEIAACDGRVPTIALQLVAPGCSQFGAGGASLPMTCEDATRRHSVQRATFSLAGTHSPSVVGSNPAGPTKSLAQRGCPRPPDQHGSGRPNNVDRGPGHQVHQAPTLDARGIGARHPRRSPTPTAPSPRRRVPRLAKLLVKRSSRVPDDTIDHGLVLG